MSYNPLTPYEESIIIHKGTEHPSTGELLYEKRQGTYLCKRCNAPLYSSEDKFDSHCGWPSFDDEMNDAVYKSQDADGYRIEITCRRCGAHLGHIFTDENFTKKNLRHCVNSVSLTFIPSNEKLPDPL